VFEYGVVLISGNAFHEIMVNKTRAIFVVLLVAEFPVLALGQDADSTAKMVSGPPFKLSDAAVAAGIDGKIMVGLTVDKSGEAKYVMILGGPSWPCGTDPKDEIEKVLEAVKQNILASKFSPAVKDGKPYSSDVMITFTVGQAYRDAENQKKIAEGIKNGTIKIIQGGVLNGKALNLPKPEYPPKARANRASGSVTVDVLIDERGKIVTAGAVLGHPYLRDAARDSACRAKFSPTTLSGQPVKVKGQIVYNFVP
jgi:TonB family protein